MAFEVKKLERITSGEFDLNTARVVLDDGLRLNVTYDRRSRNLIIHRWYKLSEERHSRLREALEQYFADLLDRGEPDKAA